MTSRRRERGEDGITLVEVLVVVVVLGIVLTALTSTFTTMLSAGDRVLSSNETTANLRVAADAMGRGIRGAARPPKSLGSIIELAGPDRLVLTSQTGGDEHPHRVEYRRVGGRLTERQEPGEKGVFDPSKAVTRQLLSGLDTSRAVFSYHAFVADGALEQLSPAGVGGVLSPEQLPLVDMVRFDLEVEAEDGRVSELTARRLVVDVRLPNVRFERG